MICEFDNHFVLLKRLEIRGRFIHRHLGTHRLCRVLSIGVYGKRDILLERESHCEIFHLVRFIHENAIKTKTSSFLVTETSVGADVS